MIKLNILIKNIGANQLSYCMIHSINKLVEKNIVSPCVFYEELQKHHLTPKFPTFPIIDYYGQEGFSIATSISTTQHILNSPAQNHCFFYLFDLSWLRPEYQYSWNFYSSLFSSIPIIVRGKHHKDIVEKCFNIKTLGIMKNFDSTKLLEIINVQRTKS